MSTKLYRINNVEMSIAGIPLKEGLVSFEIVPEGERFEDDSGAEGMVTRWDTGEKRANCNVILKGASPENQKLSALHAADVAASGGAGVVPFLLKDTLGASLVATDQAWIKGMAGKTFAVNPDDVTWVIRLVLDSPLSYAIGGN